MNDQRKKFYAFKTSSNNTKKRNIFANNSTKREGSIARYIYAGKFKTVETNTRTLYTQTMGEGSEKQHSHKTISSDRRIYMI